MTVARQAGFTAILFVACLALAPRSARPCTCAAPGTPLEELQRADAVFSGKVTAVHVGTATVPTKVEVEVYDVWKGNLGPTAAVLTAAYSSTCGSNFVAGETYLIYAFDGTCDNPCIYTHLCTRTGLLYDLPEDVIALDHYRANGYTPDEKTTWGRIKSLYETGTTAAGVTF